MGEEDEVRKEIREIQKNVADLHRMFLEVPPTAPKGTEPLVVRMTSAVLFIEKNKDPLTQVVEDRNFRNRGARLLMWFGPAVGGMFAAYSGLFSDLIAFLRSD